MEPERDPEFVNDPPPTSEDKYFRTDSKPEKNSVKVKDARIYALVAIAFFILALVSLFMGGRIQFNPHERNPAYALAIFSFSAAVVLGLWSATRYVEDVNYDTFDPGNPDEITPRAKIVQLFVGAIWMWSLWLFIVNPLIPLAIFIAGGFALGRRRWTRSIFLGSVLGCLTTPVLLLGICFFSGLR